MQKFIIFLTELLHLGLVNKSWSMEMQSIGDDLLILSGKVVDGDCWELENKITKNVKKVILTNSGGGKASEGYCIGELIREIKHRNQRTMCVFRLKNVVRWS